MVRKPLESQLKAVRKTFIKNKKALKSAWLSEILRLLWQGQKDLNPRHAVLECDAVFRVSTRPLEARVGFFPFLQLFSDTQNASI